MTPRVAYFWQSFCDELEKIADAAPRKTSIQTVLTRKPAPEKSGPSGPIQGPNVDLKRPGDPAREAMRRLIAVPVRGELSRSKVYASYRGKF